MSAKCFARKWMRLFAARTLLKSLYVLSYIKHIASNNGKHGAGLFVSCCDFIAEKQTKMPHVAVQLD